MYVGVMWSSIGSALLSPLRGRRYDVSGSRDEALHKGAPLILLVHCVFYEQPEHRELTEIIAHALAREFVLGTDAVEVCDATSVSELVSSKCVYCTVPPSDPGLSSDFGKLDLPAYTQRYAASQTPRGWSDAARTHEYAVNIASDAGAVHLVLYANKRLMSNIVMALSSIQLQIPFPKTKERTVCCRPGVVVVIFNETNRAPSGLYSPMGCEDDDDIASVSDESFLSLSFTELNASAAALAATWETIRSRCLRLASRIPRAGAGASTISFEVEMQQRSDEGEEHNSRLLSSMSSSDLRRLQPEQLRLLRLIASNLSKMDENSQFASLNAGSDRFYEQLGRYPPVMRTLRNLGFLATEDGAVLRYDAGPSGILAALHSRDRRRMLALLETLMDSP